ncbi:ABC transporter ATP-binding protein [Enterovirga sp.]|uniref:ABC transporter ATP-binding protein n=1 Tax=Enterovirga sp. TaxID=2026350 RepID=UPI002628D31D|nr:ABC transporter ATP-binding protein [Enterovirga sp.]MDB5592979.1 transporter ATP-binding protein [Enterovirga sp.]
MLTINKVSKTFGGLRAIDDVSLNVKQGQFFGIIGANGAGKTTLLNLVTGYLPPTSGTIEFEGKPIHGLPPYRVAHRGIGRTFQITQPFAEMSVLDNVMTGALFSSNGARRSLQEARAMCDEPLRLVGLTAQADLQAGALTLGGKKKLELARVLATEPKLLLLDEVMGGLTRAEIEDLMISLRRIHAAGTTVVMIEHLVHVILDLCDHVFVLNFGRELFRGTPNDVISHPEVIEAYLGKPLTAAERA